MPCPILNFFQAKERAARVIRDAESQPPGTKRFEVFVANTDAFDNGQQLFTVAIEVTTQRATDAPHGPRMRYRTRTSTTKNCTAACGVKWVRVRGAYEVRREGWCGASAEVQGA